MARQFHLFERPRRFVAGTVGVPGDRTFYLQVADDARLVSVALEKAQVSVLADRIEQLLDEIVARTGTSLPGAGDVDTDALEQPIDEEFRVGAMGLAWDSDAGLVIIEAQAPVDDAEIAEQTLLEDVEDGPDALRVRIDPLGRAGVHLAGAPGRVSRPATVPAVRPAARSGRSCLPTSERLPPRLDAAVLSGRPMSAPDELTPARRASRSPEAHAFAGEWRDHRRGTPDRRLQRHALLLGRR